MTPREAYESLLEHSTETAYLTSTMGLLHWDQRTHIPTKGHPHRIRQITSLAKLHHHRMTDPLVGEWLTEIEGSELLDDPVSLEAANAREWRRAYDKATKIPQDLAVALARSAGETESTWEKARPENDWDSFKPHLENLVSLKREQAEALGYEHEPYDALLDYFEQGETANNLDPIFHQLGAFLVRLLDALQGSAKASHPIATSSWTFPVSAQARFGLQVARTLGYDLEAGRLDVSAHPFTSGLGPGDARITTRYDEKDFGEGFFAIIHEAGHAMYHQGLPVKHWGAPVCRPISLGINESQSRMWENMVARSDAFWHHFMPLARTHFDALANVAVEDFVFSINRVEPNFIRVEADEVTYNLHILLRFDLERAIMRDDLQVEDLPTAWNDAVKEYLGLIPPDYAHGVMQDVHWAAGAIGYFPTYTLGNLYAAQFFASAERELGGMDQQFSQGEFAPLLDWLRKNIHSQGSRFRPRDLLHTVTGEELNPQYLIEYLEAKYRALYEV